MMNGRGGVTGPDLSEVPAPNAPWPKWSEPCSSRRPAASQDIEVATVQPRSGAPIRGFLRNESLYDVQLQGFDGRLYLLRRDGVAAIDRDPQPYMPPLKTTASQFCKTSSPTCAFA